VYPQFASFDSGYQINHTHNDYLEIGVDAGLLGLLIWAAFLGTTIYLVRKIPWAIGLSALCIHGLTDFPIFRPPVAALLALLVAAALTRAYQAPKDTVVIPTLKNSELDLHVRAA
jgi:O-antigen ligase